MANLPTRYLVFLGGLILLGGILLAVRFITSRNSEYAECREMCAPNPVKFYRGAMRYEYREPTPPLCECHVAGGAAQHAAADAGSAPPAVESESYTYFDP